MKSVWTIGEDPIKDEGKLPVLKDFSKHFYGTLARVGNVAKAPNLSGKVGMFSNTTIKNNSVPYYMFFPTIVGTKLGLVLEGGISYNDLVATHPFKSGWWPSHNNTYVGITHAAAKQWHVGMHCENTLAVTVSKGKISGLNVVEKFIMEHFHSPMQATLSWMAAISNTSGPPKWDVSPSVARKRIFSSGTHLLGRRLLVSDKFVFFLGINEPIAVVEDHKVLVHKDGSARMIQSTVPDIPIHKISFNDMLTYVKGTEPAKKKNAAPVLKKKKATVPFPDTHAEGIYEGLVTAVVPAHLEGFAEKLKAGGNPNDL